MRGLFFVYFRCLFFAKEFDPAHKNPEKRSQKSLYLKGKSKISSKETKALFQKKKEKKFRKWAEGVEARGAGLGG